MGKLPHGLLPVELFVDHAELDAQHDDLFCRIEAIKVGALESESLPVEELRILITCFAEHFATEERLAKEAALDFTEHAREHAKNFHLLCKACEDLQAGKLDARTFLRYLEYWFEHHISHCDKPFTQRLSESGRFHDRHPSRMSTIGWPGGGVELSA